MRKTRPSTLLARDASSREDSIQGSWLEALPFLILALAVPVVVLLQAARSTQLELMILFEDDAYYYFRIARNLAEGLGSTFDGINPTNGYHPLWMALLTPLFWLLEDRFTSLVAVKALSAFFWVASIALIYLIARRYRAKIAFGLALPVVLVTRHYWFNGLETNVFLTFLLAFGLAWPGLVDPERSRRVDVWLGAFLLALMALARLDSVFFVGVAGVLLVVVPTGRPMAERLRRAFAVLTPAAVVVALYCLGNWLVFGSVVPVSGRAKGLGPDFSNWGILGTFWRMNPFESNLTQHLSTGSLLILLVAPALVVGLRLARTSPKQNRAVGGWVLFVLLLVLANALQLLYYAAFTSWPLWRWYYYYLPLMFLFSLALILQGLLAVLPLIRRWASLAAVTIALLLCAYVARGGLWIEHALAANESYKTFSVLMANRLNVESPADAILAMGDRAGSLGYLLDRPLVQLEGLVNSSEYLERLSAGEMIPYLREQGVTHFLYSGPWVAAGETLDSLPCKVINQPLHGGGPKERFELCLDEAVFVRRLLIRTNHLEVYGVWDFP